MGKSSTKKTIFGRKLSIHNNNNNNNNNFDKRKWNTLKDFAKTKSLHLTKKKKVNQKQHFHENKFSC